MLTLQIALAFFSALFVTILATPFVLKLALKIGAVDKPDARRVHSTPTPRLGGLAIYFGFIVAILLAVPITQQVIGLILSTTIIVILGIFDDVKELSPKVKLAGQIFAAAVLVKFGVIVEFVTNPFGGMFFLGIFSIPVTIMWLVGVTNTVNLIDGLDGLAAGISSIAGLTLFIVAMIQGQVLVAILAAALIGSALGFLKYNFNPARIFMGDTGSMFLGLTLAMISVNGTLKSAAAIALIIPVLALGVPIFDTFFAIVRRYKNGVPIFRADKGHLHHRLLANGFSHKQTVLTIYAVSIVMGLVAIAILGINELQALILLFNLGALLFIGARKLGVLSMGVQKKVR